MSVDGCGCGCAGRSIAYLLAVMLWPNYRHMTDHDLEAIYTFLRAIPPPANTPDKHCSDPGE
jgi:hypothetical protein